MVGGRIVRPEWKATPGFVECKWLVQTGDRRPPARRHGHAVSPRRRSDHRARRRRPRPPRRRLRRGAALDQRRAVGIIVQQTTRELALRDAQDKEIHIPASEIETQMKQTRSLMPEQLLRDLTAQEAADLLAFLQTLK